MIERVKGELLLKTELREDDFNLFPESTSETFPTVQLIQYAEIS